MSESNVERCIGILKKAKSDNEKFAALLMVAKLVKSEDCGDAQRHQVLEAVGFDFPIRLLKSTKGPEGEPPYTYPALAAMVLSCFCSQPSLVVHPRMLAALPTFNTLIKSNHTEEEAEALYTDCYDCLTCIAAQREGGLAMLKHHTVTALVEVWTLKAKGHQRAHELLLYLMHQWGAATWRENMEALRKLLEGLTDQFSQQKDQDKFETCSLICKVLNSADEDQVNAVFGPWVWKIHEELSGILKSKLGSDQRDPALCLASVMVERLGVSWAMGEDGEEKRIMLLMVHLTCIEVRMLLEDSQFTQVCEKASLLSACYSLLEQVISFLTSGPTLALDERQVNQLHAALVGAFNAVMYFLSSVEQHHEEQLLSPVVVASVRVLGSWIAEETTALKKEVLSRLPFVIKICQLTFEQNRISSARASLSSISLEGASNSTQTTESQEKGVVESKQSSSSTENPASSQPTQERSTDDVLKFLLPGLCHLTAEDKAQGVLLEEGMHTLLIAYFHDNWENFLKGKHKDQTEMTLTTLCGIFLNIAVLETSLVSQHSDFKDFLTFIMKNSTSLGKSDVVLNFNLTVLGLMLLQNEELSEVCKASDLQCFLKSCVTLLRRAHTVSEEKNSKEDSSGLRVCENYVEHWDSLEELWFLGMQALTGLVPKCDMLVENIASCGWLTMITKVLTNQRGADPDDPVLTCYSDLLASIGRARESTMDQT